MKKKLIFIVLAMALAFAVSACAQADVVGKASITSFNEVLNAIPDRVQNDDQIGGWALTAPDGTVRFIWSRDYSKTANDVMLLADVKPFIDAGLDTSRLRAGMISGDKIIVGRDLGSDQLKYEGEVTPIASYEQIVDLYRKFIGYHTALDHYGVDLSGGNMFEWAKDMKTNDKDIVFVLDPKVFLDAGVDPSKVEGWVFAKVKKEDENGKPIEVDKFLKPFDING